MSFNGGYQSDGSVVDATELIAGIAKIGTQGQVNTGTNNTTIVTPLKLSTLLNLVLKYVSGQGNNSIIPKQGIDNIADAAFATIAAGDHNHAGAIYSSAQGNWAEALTYNEAAKAGGGFYNVKGSAQSSMLNLFNIIPSSSGSVWGVVPDGNGFGSANKWAPPNNCVIQFRALFTVTQNSGSFGTTGDSWTGLYEGAVKNTNGSLAWLGGLPVLREVRQDASFTPSTGFVISANEIIGFVGGMSDRTLHANIAITLSQTKFGISSGVG